MLISHFSSNTTLCCYSIFFHLFFISWRLITLQYCSGFCHTLTWISHGFTNFKEHEEYLHALSYLTITTPFGYQLCFMFQNTDNLRGQICIAWGHTASLRIHNPDLLIPRLSLSSTVPSCKYLVMCIWPFSILFLKLFSLYVFTLPRIICHLLCFIFCLFLCFPDSQVEKVLDV